jgi:DNA-binding Lrp family transcriptional regulator
MNVMDETDVKLLGKLLSDARLSYRRIADEIGVSAATVLARVKKLEKDRVILFSNIRS